LVYRPELGDILVRLIFPSNIGKAGTPGFVYGLKLTVGQVPYEVRMDGVPEFGLYRCDNVTCLSVATLSGGVETTGDEIRVAVPINAIGASEGMTLTGLRAFTAVGNVVTGAASLIDEDVLPDAQIPQRRVSLSIAPAGTPPSQVAFNTPTSLVNGNF